MNKWVNEKWSWYTNLPWYWKILGFAVGLGLVCLMALFVFGRIRSQLTSNTEASAVAHNNMVDSLVDEKVEKDEELVGKIEELRKEAGMVDEKIEISNKEAASKEERLENATSAEEIRNIVKE